MFVLAQLSSSQAVWLAFAVAGLALAAAVAAVVASRRSVTAAGEHAEQPTWLLERTEEHVRGLQSRLRTCDAERRRLERVRHLAGSEDSAELATRLLDELASLPGAEAATVTLAQRSGGPLVVSRGLQSFPPGAEAQELHPPLPADAAVAEIAYRHAPTEGASRRIGGTLVAPLRADTGEELGSLCVHWQGGADRPVELEEELVALARDAAGMARAGQQVAELREAAARDPLTSLYNRRFFHEELVRQISRARRYRRPLALMMLDIDDFKQINERVGHLEADAVLGEVAAKLALCVRGADVPSRIGGDEFAVIMPESSESDGIRLYHRIRAAIDDAPALTRVQATVSAGVTEFRDQDATSLFNRTEAALRQAKAAGKAGLTVASEAPSDLDPDANAV